MGRSTRINAPNILFHVINRGNGRNEVFHTKQDYSEYLELVELYKKKFPVKLYHYVLMSNHIHFLIEPLEENVLSRFMQGVTLAHTRRFNLRYNSVGHVWQGRFKAIPIQTDAYFLQCGRYIELNPVRANIVQHPSNYFWSSYHFYATGKPNPLLASYPFYDELSRTEEGRQDRYKSFVEEELQNIEKKESLRFSEQQVYGSTTFIETLKDKYGFKLLRSTTGRPQKDEKNGT